MCGCPSHSLFLCLHRPPSFPLSLVHFMTPPLGATSLEILMSSLIYAKSFHHSHRPNSLDRLSPLSSQLFLLFHLVTSLPRCSSKRSATHKSRPCQHRSLCSLSDWEKDLLLCIIESVSLYSRSQMCLYFLLLRFWLVSLVSVFVAIMPQWLRVQLSYPRLHCALTPSLYPFSL